MDARSLDLLVVGTGAAGLTIAHACREAGWSVAIVDKQPFGGTCALRGCDPKKVLVGAAAAADQAARLQGHGLGDPPPVRWAELMRWKEEFTDPVPDARERSFAAAGIEAFRGVARFRSIDEVEIEGEVLRPRHVAIAAGSKPRPLGIPGDEHVISSTEFLALSDLPERVVFLGGGYISMEFAHLCRSAGASVTVVQRGARVLKPFDPDLVRQLEGSARAMGIDLRLETEVTAIERDGERFRVRARGKDGNVRTVEADLVVHGAGRVPDIEELGLERVGIATGRRGIEVDEHLRSVSQPRVFAAGDAAASGPPLTPVASLEGRVVAHNLLHPDALRAPDYRGIPSVAFTLPPLASVGHTEASAREEGLRFRVEHGDSTDWFSARRLRERAAGHKVLVEEKSGRILGAHLLGEHSEEVINLFALAIRHDLNADQLRETPFSYPTRSSDLSYML